MQVIVTLSRVYDYSAADLNYKNLDHLKQVAIETALQDFASEADEFLDNPKDFVSAKVDIIE